MALLFVYGTLMRREANHRVLGRLGARFLAEGRTVAPRRLVDLGPYPALLPLDPADDAASPVWGEVYEVPEGAFGELDAFEGAPELYVRERLDVELLHDGGQGGQAPSRVSAVRAWTYVFVPRPPAACRALLDGRYRGGGRRLLKNALEVAETLDNGAVKEDVSHPRATDRSHGPR